MSEKLYSERKQAAAELTEADISKAESAGLNVRVEAMAYGHYPVMAAEALEQLAIRPDGIYIDATAGLGGHTAQIAQRLTTGLVIANDRDELSLAMARENTREWSERIRFHHGAFSELAQAMAERGSRRRDGLLADLGVSRYQLTAPERGFSFLSDGPLDMRMDQTTGMTAADLVNHTPERALADLIYQLGEERRARRIARAIVRARPIRSTLHLADVVERAVHRTGRLHPATQTLWPCGWRSTTNRASWTGCSKSARGC